MEPLRPSDPPRIGGCRLLGRLGEGSTGLVYLARSVGGTLLALKVLHRPRRPYRGQAVHHPFLVPVVGGGTDENGTWMAYPYEPGPALPLAVAAHGPLPRRSVRAFGGMLAGALGALHAAGLTHGGLHPGKVLLAADGPRLTDTAGPVVRGDEASDIFALGQVLVYAATGRTPYDDPAELADVPRSLLEVLQACLDPDPALRPVARELSEELGGNQGEGWLPPALTAEIAARAQHAPVGEGHTGGPHGVQAGERQAPHQRRGRHSRGFDAVGSGLVGPPAPRPGAAGPAEPGTAAAGGEPTAEPATGTPTRRGLIALAAGGLVVAGGTAFGAWLVRRAKGRTGAPGATGARWTIGLHVDLSGPQARYGRGQYRGITMALEELNEHGNLPFQLELAVHDDVGDPPSAARAAAELAADPAVLMVIGPTGDAVADSAARVYQDAALPVLSLSVGNLAHRADYPVLLHGRPGTGTTGLAIPGCLAAGEHPPARIGLVDDRAADTHSWLITRAVSGAVDRTRVALVPRVLPAGTEDFAPVTAELLAEGVDAVVYGGLPDGAARLALALRAAGWSGTAIAGEAAMDPLFLSDAGEAAEGWRFVAGHTDPASDTRAGGFAPVHRRRFGEDPEPYAAEGYDAARMVVIAMQRTLEEGESLNRANVLRRLRILTYNGVARPLAFDRAGDYAGTGPAAYQYEVEAGRFRFLGPVAAPTTGSDE
ncbi:MULTISPECIES: ABC transporter substrate-binding protein [unclassified Streptomyces]|uniref:ABC transporter substrate-binding protein n=1 Tax=unclassified Streptomyces TaxID=2593676 RepID=UPI00190869B1|nr:MULTISPECIES: ABC transporter substrate-binding protein [unclassified Streptomyces]MCU4746069.1 ABC transporter substrate-binding protein [Streptomyces sp. G-5]QQN76398.1 ABC transporter substrate-binding protein [Streptomyces sp. XC 2026]